MQSQPENSAFTHILVVDDDDDVRESVQGFLEQEGFPVRTARNGEEALDELRHEPLPSLLLLDLMMPVLDGAGFMGKFVHLPITTPVPVMVVSASLLAPQLFATYPQVVDVLSKPYDPDMLLRKIRQHTASAPHASA